jgi:hypothetical protein
MLVIPTYNICVVRLKINVYREKYLEPSISIQGKILSETI